MIYLVQYDPTTGRVIQRVQVTKDSDAALYENAVRVPKNIFDSEPERTMTVYAPTETPQEKAKVTLTPNKTEFNANGSDVATITLSGMVQNGKLKVGGDIVDIDFADPTFELTSNVPRAFRIDMADDAHYSDAIKLKAVQDGASVSRQPPAAAIVLTGRVPSTGETMSRQPPAGSLTLTGLAPSIA